MCSPAIVIPSLVVWNGGPQSDFHCCVPAVFKLSKNAKFLVISYFFFNFLIFFQSCCLDVRLARYRKQPTCDFDLCINEPNYPKEQIRQIMQNNTYMKDFLAELMGETSVFDSRSGLDDYKNICPVNRFTLQPRYGRNIDGLWRYIVNIDKYIQFFEIDKCK